MNHDGVVSLVPMTVASPPDADVGRLTRPKVEVSLDDSATWRRAPVRPTKGANTWDVVVIVPPSSHAEFVSLRVEASDDAGNRVDQTIIRAYAVG